MIVNRKAVVVSVLGAMLAAGGDAGAAEPMNESHPVGSAASQMEYVLEALAGGDLLGGRAGLESIFEGMTANKPAEGKTSGARLINVAAGDKDEGWPPKNPFGPQKPPESKPQPPPQTPPQTPPVKDPPRQTPPPPPPPRLPPTVVPTN